MGLFHLLHEATHALSGAAHGLEHASEAAGRFLAANAPTIAATALSTVVFVGVTGAITAATGGAGLPLALAAGAAASGASGYLAGQLLAHRPIHASSLLVATATTVGITLATAGLARLVPTSLLARAAAPVAERLAGTLESDAGPLVRGAVDAVAGGAVGAAVQVGGNAIAGHGLTTGLAPAIVSGVVAGALASPAGHVAGPLPADERPPAEQEILDAPLGSEAGTARIDRALDAAPPDVLRVMDSLLAVPGARDHVADFFDGAHIVVEDAGALYDQARALPSAVKRFSSHASLGPQYQVAGDSTGPILIGRTPDGKGTWLQLEGHRADLTLAGAKDLVPHMIDYVKYRLTGRNQSRFGSSSYTDMHPLELEEGAPAPQPPSPGIVGAIGASERP